ncbi:hypothetical protein EJB05_10788, partial [Eragrostis curvula]
MSLLLLLVLLLRLYTPGSAWAPVSVTITVDWRGRGDFRTVQSAVNSVPRVDQDPCQGRELLVRASTSATAWRRLPSRRARKRYILLEGDGPSATDISFDAHALGGIDQIMREARAPSTRSRRKVDQAVAALVNLEKFKLRVNFFKF